MCISNRERGGAVHRILEPVHVGRCQHSGGLMAHSSPQMYAGCMHAAPGGGFEKREAIRYAVRVTHLLLEH